MGKEEKFDNPTAYKYLLPNGYMDAQQTIAEIDILVVTL